MFIEAKDDGSGGDNWSYKSRKVPVKSSPPTNQHSTLYRPDAIPVAQPSVSKHWREKYHIIPWTCLPQAHWGVFQLCLWPLKAPGYLGEGCLPVVSPLMPVPNYAGYHTIKRINAGIGFSSKKLGDTISPRFHLHYTHSHHTGLDVSRRCMCSHCCSGGPEVERSKSTSPDGSCTQDAWQPMCCEQAVWEAATICPTTCKLTFDLLTSKVVSRVTFDVGYLCANFSLPRPLCSRLRPDVCDRQTLDVRRASSLNAP